MQYVQSVQWDVLLLDILRYVSTVFVYTMKVNGVQNTGQCANLRLSFTTSFSFMLNIQQRSIKHKSKANRHTYSRNEK